MSGELLGEDLTLTSSSVSWDNLPRMSVTVISGFDVLSRAMASGTALLIAGSPYCSKCSIARNAMPFPRSSPMATKAIPSTDTPWCASPSFLYCSLSLSMCSPQAAKNCCTFNTFPLPQYAHISSTVCAYLATFGFSTLTISTVASTAACFRKNSRPRPRKANRPNGWSKSASGRVMSALQIACAHS
eukprot:1180349-Prorocentrum_minimum.AAC.6